MTKLAKDGFRCCICNTKLVDAANGATPFIRVYGFSRPLAKLDVAEPGLATVAEKHGYGSCNEDPTLAAVRFCNFVEHPVCCLDPRCVVHLLAQLTKARRAEPAVCRDCGTTMVGRHEVDPWALDEQTYTEPTAYVVMRELKR